MKDSLIELLHRQSAEELKQFIIAQIETDFEEQDIERGYNRGIITDRNPKESYFVIQPMYFKELNK